MIARWLDKLVDTVERAEVLDVIADAIQPTIKKVVSPAPVANLLSGTPLGHPAHPLLVALPLGSWSMAWVFDAVGDEEGAQRLIGLGVLSAFPALATGWSDWAYTNSAERRVGLVHALSNYVSIGAYAASYLVRRRGHRGAGVALAMLGSAQMTVGGWLGGHLAYALGVGVDTTAFQHSVDEWTPVATADTVRAGELSEGDADGVPLVLTRDATGAVVAMADRCTHRGAPLHDGELVDGCIVCPWHDSEFALDGSVVRGPATRPQAVFETQVVDGLVQVRRADEVRALRKNPVGV